MKTSFATISCLVVAVLAQTSPVPASDATSPAPEAANTPVPNVDIDQMPQMPSSMTVDAGSPGLVFDLTMNKYTLLSMNVVQSGDVWYLPVCTVDSITTAGSSAAPPSPESRQFAIQLAPVPQNATRMMMRVMRTMFRSIEAAAREPTRYIFGRPSTGMTYMPMQ